MEKGLIFDIQGYSVHDGPGCRTLVFLGGCPLECSWCSNPEGRHPKKQMMFRRGRCAPKNYHCRSHCPHDAVSVGADGYPVFDRKLCDACLTFECAEGCMKEAVRVAGKEMSVEEVMKVLRRDQGFWGEDGGVTFTGGEPLAQGEFLMALLKKCRENYMHTAIETCACAPLETLLEAAGFCDFIFADIKHMDPEEHGRGTGVTNQTILRNIAALAGSGTAAKIVVRLPVIPGFNDGEKNIAATAEFMKSIRLNEVNILSFHRLGASKYEQLGMEYKHEYKQPPSKEEMEGIKRMFEERGILCHVDEGTPF